MTRNRILSVIVLVWGSALLIKRVIVGAPNGSAAYQSGATAAYVVAGIMVIAGAYGLLKKPKQN